MAYTYILLSGSDLALDSYIVKSTDGGNTFSEPITQPNLADTYENNERQHYSGTVYYNKYHKKWFMLGHMSRFRDNNSPVSISNVHIARTSPIFGNVDADKGLILNHKVLDFPIEHVTAYSMGQIVELDNGDIIVPFTFTSTEIPKGMVVTVRYTFDGDDLKVVKCGTPIVTTEYKRGCGEPSLAKLNGKYYLTIRTDVNGLYAVSEDGFTFSEPKPYVWENGEALGNYNTQQHWMISKDGLFLAYTRKGAHNDHVFRHRAPIFMARFDEDKEVILKDTEVILVPELGARLGNFCAINPNDNEAWLTTAEWMQSWNEELGVCEKYGSDNSIWIAKVYWKE